MIEVTTASPEEVRQTLAQWGFVPATPEDDAPRAGFWIEADERSIRVRHWTPEMMPYSVVVHVVGQYERSLREALDAKATIRMITRPVDGAAYVLLIPRLSLVSPYGLEDGR